MSDLARAFLADICANPDDDTPRLVFADWLEENGDGERAGFIRVQVERARLPEWEAAQVRLRLREKELIGLHGTAWRSDLPTIKGVTWGGFRRGFVAEAALANFTALRSGADACFAAAPVQAISTRWPTAGEKCETIPPIPGLRELSLAGHAALTGDVARLAAAPLLSTLRVLNVSGCDLEAEGFRGLVASPHLRHLKALRALGNSVGNAGIEALRASHIEALEELDLSENPAADGGGYGYGQDDENAVINAEGMAALAEWPGLARLRSLKLSGNDLRRDGLLVLLRSPSAAGLKELTLRSAGLPNDVGRDFADAHPSLRLDVLDLGGNLLEGDVYGYFGRAAAFDELKALKLDRCEMRANDTRRLTEAAFMNCLRILDISHDTFGPEGLEGLLARRPEWLHTLRLRDTDIGDEGAACLAESPASDGLLEVDLADNRLGDKAAAALAATAHLRSLLVLRLGDNPISKRAADALAGSELGRRLAVLDMGEAEENPS